MRNSQPSAAILQTAVLCVGISSRPARNSPSGESTLIHRTGTEPMRSMDLTDTENLPRPPSAERIRDLCERV